MAVWMSIALSALLAITLISLAYAPAILVYGVPLIILIMLGGAGALGILIGCWVFKINA